MISWRFEARFWDYFYLIEDSFKKGIFGVHKDYHKHKPTEKQVEEIGKT